MRKQNYEDTECKIIYDVDIWKVFGYGACLSLLHRITNVLFVPRRKLFLPPARQDPNWKRSLNNLWALFGVEIFEKLSGAHLSTLTLINFHLHIFFKPKMKTLAAQNLLGFCSIFQGMRAA